MSGLRRERESERVRQKKSWSGFHPGEGDWLAKSRLVENGRPEYFEIKKMSDEPSAPTVIVIVAWRAHVGAPVVVVVDNAQTSGGGLFHLFDFLLPVSDIVLGKIPVFSEKKKARVCSHAHTLEILRSFVLFQVI